MIDCRHTHTITSQQAISTIRRLHPHQLIISPGNYCRRRVRERGCVPCVPHVFSRFPSCHPGSPSPCVALSQTLDTRHIYDFFLTDQDYKQAGEWVSRKSIMFWTNHTDIFSENINLNSSIVRYCQIKDF